MIEVFSRRTAQTILGLIWFIDGIFQLKPQMFTSAFIQQVILPTGQGQPHWIALLVNGAAGFANQHIVVWDAVFAAVQLLLGLALMFNVRPKTAILLSIAWSLIVWAFGEGFGQLLSGQALLLNGAPGAALVYALIGGAIWPARGGDPQSWNKRGIRFAQIALGALFALGVVLQLQSTYLTPKGLSQAVAVSWFANLIAHQGVVISVLLAVIELVLAVMLVFRVRIRLAVWSAIVVSLVFWWIGQSFGQVFDPLATDFNSGILMVLLAICAGRGELGIGRLRGEAHTGRRAILH